MGYEIDTAFPVTEESAGWWARFRDRPSWRAIGAVLFAVCLAGAGVGGFLVGNSPDADLDAVRSAAAAEGRQAGLESGTQAGYDQGYRAAQERTYGPLFSAAYKRAYAAEFEAVGLEPPQRIRVPVER
jgi:hypothetical protein